MPRSPFVDKKKAVERWVATASWTVGIKVPIKLSQAGQLLFCKFVFGSSLMTVAQAFSRSVMVR